MLRCGRVNLLDAMIPFTPKPVPLHRRRSTEGAYRQHREQGGDDGKEAAGGRLLAGRLRFIVGQGGKRGQGVGSRRDVKQ